MLDFHNSSRCVCKCGPVQLAHHSVLPPQLQSKMDQRLCCAELWPCPRLRGSKSCLYRTATNISSVNVKETSQQITAGNCLSPFLAHSTALHGCARGPPKAALSALLLRPPCQLCGCFRHPCRDVTCSNRCSIEASHKWFDIAVLRQVVMRR